MDKRFGFNITPQPEYRKPTIFCIDSTNVTNKTNYTVETTGYRNVIHIELVKAIIPNPHNDDFVILLIHNNDNIKGNTANLDGAFCTIERSTGDNTYFIYKRHNNDHNSAYAYYYDQPQKLNNINVTLMRPDGSVPDYGIKNHFLAFEINTLNQPNTILQ